LPATSPLPEVPAQTVILDAVPLSFGTQFVAGLPSAEPSRPGGLGPVKEAESAAAWEGIGSGPGTGLGPGTDGGTGGGVYRAGAGVTDPRLLKQVRPSYTPDAMRAKIQGFVELEVVVRADGTPGAIRIVRSLDPGGLDVSAIEAVRQWFAPGELGGVPVDVLVEDIAVIRTRSVRRSRQ
jgi:TonB family protein